MGTVQLNESEVILYQSEVYAEDEDFDGVKPRKSVKSGVCDN